MENNSVEPIAILTIKEAAGLMQLSQRTVQRLISRKALPAFKVGCQWRLRASELAKWIQSLEEL